MRLHDSPRDVEPEARSLSFRSLGSPIAIEYVRQMFGSDPASGIRNRDREHSVAGPRAKCDGAALRGELDRVAEQVREHLRNAVRVGVDFRWIDQIQDEGDVLCVR